MSKRMKRHNLHLHPDEENMLSELAEITGLNRMQVVRQLIALEHHRLKVYLDEHELEPGGRLVLAADGYIHREPLAYDRKRAVRNVRGAVVLDDWTTWTLARLAARFKRQPEKLLADLVTDATDGTEFAWEPANHG